MDERRITGALSVVDEIGVDLTAVGRGRAALRDVNGNLAARTEGFFAERGALQIQHDRFSVTTALARAGGCEVYGYPKTVCDIPETDEPFSQLDAEFPFVASLARQTPHPRLERATMGKDSGRRAPGVTTGFRAEGRSRRREPGVVRPGARGSTRPPWFHEASDVDLAVEGIAPERHAPRPSHTRRGTVPSRVLRWGIEMGITRVDAKITNMTDDSRSFDIELVVDTGAVFSFLPGARLIAIGAAPTRKQRFRQMDGSVIERQVGNVKLRIAGTEDIVPVVFGETDDTSVLGVTALEILALAVDPTSGKLEPVTLLAVGVLDRDGNGNERGTGMGKTRRRKRASFRPTRARAPRRCRDG